MADFEHGKAKANGKKYYTRKSRRIQKFNNLPRSDGTWYWATDKSRSRRRKYYQKLSNRLLRKNKYIQSGGSYKKIFNLRWELD